MPIVFLLCVVKLSGVDAMSENVFGSQNQVKSQLGAKQRNNRQTLLFMSSHNHTYITSIKFAGTIHDVLKIHVACTT